MYKETVKHGKNAFLFIIVCTFLVLFSSALLLKLAGGKFIALKQLIIILEMFFCVWYIIKFYVATYEYEKNGDLFTIKKTFNQKEEVLASFKREDVLYLSPYSKNHEYKKAARLKNACGNFTDKKYILVFKNTAPFKIVFQPSEKFLDLLKNDGNAQNQ